jgi:hypothetical protein
MIFIFYFFAKKTQHFFLFSAQAGNLESANKCFSPSKIKQWAMDDLAQTMSWLDSQEEKVCAPIEKECVFMM